MLRTTPILSVNFHYIVVLFVDGLNSLVNFTYFRCKVLRVICFELLYLLRSIYFPRLAARKMHPDALYKKRKTTRSEGGVVGAKLTQALRLF